MHPFFTLFGLRIPAYGTMVVLGAGAGLTLCLARVEKGMRRTAVQVLLWAALGALAGAKGLYLMTMPEGVSLRDALLSGFVFYGGLIGGLAAGGLAAKRLKADFVLLLDAAAPGIALGHGIGRVGCFLAGCCYGRPAPPPWGLVMPQALGAPRDIALFPVQLVEAALNLALCALLLGYGRRTRQAGRVAGLYLMLYAVERFLLEFLRFDAVRGFAGGLSTGQWMSLALLPAGALLFGCETRIELALRGASLSARVRGLLPVQLTAGLARDAAGKLFFCVQVYGRRVKNKKRRRLPANLRPEIGELLKILRIQSLRADAVIGVRDDAALTARLCGGAQTLLGALGFAGSVRPDFQRDTFSLSARCIISFRTGQAMRIGCKALHKIAKGAYQSWRTRLKTSCVPPWRT